jgi:hypothetical protein
MAGCDAAKKGTNGPVEAARYDQICTNGRASDAPRSRSQADHRLLGRALILVVLR